MATLSKEFWLVAFFLSKYGNTIEGKNTSPPKELNTLKWSEAYKKFYPKFNDGKTFRTFENSLKNCRDSFDGHIGNSTRQGWRDINKVPIKLPTLAKSIFNKYNNIDRDSIWDEVKNILSPKEDIVEPNNKNQVRENITNPDWTREELIIALDLYFDLDQGQMHKGNPDVIRVSNELRRLNIHNPIPDPNKFRNPSGISRRLGNFKSMDIGYKGNGLTNYGKLAKEIYLEFYQYRDKLRKEADLIKQLYLKPKSEKNVVKENNVNYKSKFLFQFHKNRETDPLVNKVKKEMILLTENLLICEICNFDPVAFYGELGNNLIEIHYNKELQDEPGLESSSMEDFIIVCSNCHKVLDKNFGLINADNLKEIIR